MIAGGLDQPSYFEVGAVITTLILLGRFLEARARRRSGEAIRALVELGGRAHRLSRRHSEIVAALLAHPDGLTAEQLDTLVKRFKVTA